MTPAEWEALKLRVRALELAKAPVIPPAVPTIPTVINIQFAGETLPVGPKVKGLAGVPQGQLVHLWAVLPWRIVAGSFCNAQWHANGVQVPNTSTVGAQASATGGAQSITATAQFTGIFTAAPQLSLYSAVSTVIDPWMVGGLVWPAAAVGDNDSLSLLPAVE